MFGFSADGLKPPKSQQRSWVEPARRLRAPDEEWDAPERRGEALGPGRSVSGRVASPGLLSSLWDGSQSDRAFALPQRLGKILRCFRALPYRIPLALFWTSLYLKMPIRPFRLTIHYPGLWSFGDPRRKRHASQRLSQYVRNTHWSYRSNWVQTTEENWCLFNSISINSECFCWFWQ